MELKFKNKLLSIINKFDKRRILIIGDVILDEYITGEVSRISPEAPVPVVEVKNRWFSPGGAGNVANNLVNLGAKVVISGIIGNDYFGVKIKSMLKKNGSDISGLITDMNRPTVLKSRIIARQQQVVRVDVESKKKISADQFDKISSFIEKQKKSIDAIILSDYGKGTITSNVIEQVVEIKKKFGIPVVVDPKIEHFMNYKNVTIMTPNKKEASEGSNILITDEKSLYKAGNKILKDLNLDALLITRSEEGMSLFKKSEIVNIPTEAKEVFDVTGAGDTVISVMSLCLSAGADFKYAAVLSNIAAGEVVKELGTAAISKDKLVNLVRNYNNKTILNVL
ncbi:MAG TPA: D-glycero-beta-D-manno-heptose-7-phosphate kinase [bacterium]|nr:D-glycero-beta-D-manno-heptose-7-phosphate kinase [bacterium]HPN30484.1 D-glycero-beta-D-manno-heptose-7-phosphate kinase [bacterium]